jgi:hypothetical protein
MPKRRSWPEVSRRRLLQAAGAAMLLPDLPTPARAGATGSPWRTLGSATASFDHSSVVRHATYYISAGGSDGNSGADAAHPWRTVAPLNSMRFFGEDVHILFRGGDTFAGGLTTTLVGRPGHRCTIGSYGTGKATLTDLASRTTDIAQLEDSEQLTVRNLRFVATPGNNPGTRRFIPVNHSSGLHIVSTRSSSGRFRGITVENCDFRHSEVGLFFDAHADGVDGFEDVLVRDCTFEDTYRLGVMVYGIGANAGGPVDQNRDIAVEDCQFRYIYGDPHFPSEAQPIFIGNTTGVAIRRNLVAHCCGYGGYNPLGGSTAIGVTNCRDFTIQYNEVCGTRSSTAWDGSAIDADQDTQNGEISYNLTYLNAGPAIQFGSYGGKITSDIAIHHNISYNDARGNKRSSVQGAIRAWGNADRIAVYNNTIYLDRAGTIGTPSALSFEGGDIGVNTHFNVYNNILKTTQGVPMIRPNGTVSGEYSPTYLDATVRFVANLYDSSGAALTISTDDTLGSHTAITTLAAWRAASQEKLGAATYGVIGDAGLASPGGFRPPPQGYLPSQPVGRVRNFDLAARSPARGHAVDPRRIVTVHAPLALAWTDFHGDRAPIADIGAVTYAGRRQGRSS